MDTSAVLFDIDGTLVDSTYHHAIAWQRAFTRLGHVLAMWRIHRSIGMGGDKLVAQVAGPEVEERHGDDLRDSWRQEYLRVRAEVRPLDGAATLIRALSDDGMRVGLASSGDPQFAREAVELLGIGDRTEVLTTSEDADDSKPEPDLIRVTLDRMGGVEEAVLVGDTPYDVEAANRAGMACIALLTGGFSSAELVEAGAVLVAEAPEELIGARWPEYLTRL